MGGQREGNKGSASPWQPAPEQAQQQHKSISVQFASQGRGQGRGYGFRDQAPVVVAAGQGLQGGGRQALGLRVEGWGLRGENTHQKCS